MGQPADISSDLGSTASEFATRCATGPHVSVVKLDVPALAHALALLGPHELAPLADALDGARNSSRVSQELLPFMTVQEAARRAGVSPKTVHNWLSDGRLVRHGVPRRPLVEREELEQLLRPPTRRVSGIRRSVPRGGPVKFTARARAA
jgi:excisionase family DNA binding protein